MIQKYALLLLLITLIAACSGTRSLSGPKWVEKKMVEMTIEEKVGQIMLVAFHSRYYNEDNAYFNQLKKRVKEHHLGSVMFYRSNPYDIARNIEVLQAEADIPLLVMADIEWGVTMRVNQGTNFLENMAVGATGSTEYAYEMGQVTGREAKAMGIHIGFSPVMDVNNNPDNIIINTRSYGENPDAVGKLGAAFIRGMQEQGVLATAKHFPGHGDTNVDTHLGLPTITASRERLQEVELAPFKAAVDAGVAAVMVAHITYSEFPEMDGHPATLDNYFVQDVLRKELGFNGIVMTDAMDMGGITNNYWSGEAAVRALNAGVDVILIPPNFEATVNFMVSAVRDGRVSMERLNEAVRKVLQTKADFGLNDPKPIDIDNLEKVLAAPAHTAAAEKIANSAMTFLRDEQNVLPLEAEKLDTVMVLTITDRKDGSGYSSNLSQEVSRRVPVVIREVIDTRTTEEDLQRILAMSDSVDAIVTGVFVRWGSYKGSVALDSTSASLMDQIFRVNTPMAVIAFGSPYIVRQLPAVPSYICAYDTDPLAVRAGVRAVFGEIPISARLPVSIPGHFKAGDGMDKPARNMELQEAFNDALFTDAYDVLKKAMADSILPGAQLAIVQDGKLLASRAFGKQTYDPSSANIDRETIYDLASVTKVISTALSSMRLWEQKRIRLDIPVKSYLPAFNGGLKDSVTIRHLLTHSSGVHWWSDLWNKAKTRQEALNYIYELPLNFTPGDSMIYSDLGMIMLGEILQMVTGEGQDEFANRLIYKPLGLKNTMYTPSKTLLPRIPPTEIGGSMNRGLIHGDVHDENTHFLNGVSSHAGLFSTADDLAIVGQMLVNGGIYGHKRLLKPSTIAEWTARQSLPEGTDRALGWDTPSDEKSSAGDYFSSGSFGHLGFTGTSFWVDPNRGIVVVLLSNRVHPTRERGGMYQVRRDFHQAVMTALLKNSVENSDEIAAPQKPEFRNKPQKAH
ncbi:MAG: glycoside hydrolase family 3 N-terminal domain-containing protein [Calditrichia bacterium]